MATPRKGERPRKAVNHQVWWQDCEAWVQQLYEEHGGYVHCEVCLPPGGHGLQTAIRISITARGVGKEQRELWSDWAPFNWTDAGHAEKVALQLLSRALLELSADAERSERLAQLSFGAIS
jgi:hypothetical protein